MVSKYSKTIALQNALKPEAAPSTYFSHLRQMFCKMISHTLGKIHTFSHLFDISAPDKKIWTALSLKII